MKVAGVRGRVVSMTLLPTTSGVTMVTGSAAEPTTVGVPAIDAVGVDVVGTGIDTRPVAVCT